MIKARSLAGVCVAMATCLIFAGGASAQQILDSLAELQKIGVDEHLGDHLPLDLRLVDDAGQSVKLGDFFAAGKPVILTLFYSDCPMLCSLVLSGLEKAANEVNFTPGVDYRLLSVSINPDESPAQSKAGRERFGGGLKKGATTDAWLFFTADSAIIGQLTRAVGFRYFKVEETGQFAHPAVVMVLTPDGRMSRYLYGIDYPPNDVRLSLLEASEGRIGNTVDRLILYCYHYDPTAKGYTILAANVMKLGGGVSVVLLGGLVGALLIREKRVRK